MSIRSKSTTFAWCALGALVVTIAGCGSGHPDIRVDSASRSEANLEAFGTYTWRLSAALIRDPGNEWTPPDLDVGAEIQYRVDEKLREAGMRKVTSGADVAVVYAVGVDMAALDVVIEDETITELENVPRASFVILLIDPDSTRVIWAGVADGEIEDDRTTEEVQERIAFAVDQMFKGFGE